MSLRHSSCLAGSLRAQFFILLFSLTALSGNLLAQSTNISIGTTTLQPSVKRLGINLGTLTFYDSGQTTQNLVVSNSGFEGQIWNSTIRCMAGTATSCVDDDQWSGWPAGFWNGATYEVFYGASAGRKGTVTYSTATVPSAGQGITLNFGDSGVAPAQGDYLIVRKTVPGGSSGGWWPTTSGAGVIGDNLTDLPPGTLGKQTTVLTAPSASDSAKMTGYFDSLEGKTFVQLNGTYQVQFKAKAKAGSGQINVQVSREGFGSYYSQITTLTNSWNTYNVTFTAAENGYAVGLVGVSFATVGADAFELDDVSLTKMNGDPTNPTVFRDPVVNALRKLQPGIIRYWGGQLGDTLDNLLTPQFGRQRSGYLAWYTEADTIDYGLHDFLVLCQTVGAEPWFVVPSTFSTTDANNLIEYLGGSSTTPYGSKRAALGQTTPWTQVFTSIHLEFGNEAWNSTFKGGSIEYSEPYGARAQAIFGVMRANPNYIPSQFDLVLGGQSAWPGRNTGIQDNCNNNDSFDVAPYVMSTVDSFSDNESLFGSSFAEPEAYMSSSASAEGLNPGMVFQDAQAIKASSHNVPMSFYEINMGTLNGAITQTALNNYVSSLGAGLTVVDTMLQGMEKFGVVNQNLFALPQYYFVRPDGSDVYLWGSVVDMGVTDRKRPQFLAMQLANQALSSGATMLQTSHSGANPTWDQPLVNTVQMNGAHFIQSYAFAQGSNLSLIVFNLSRNSALPVTFNGPNAPSGTVQMQQLTSANPTDNNEISNVVGITPSTLNGFNPANGLSLPPYSMTVLTWNSNGVVSTPAPAISGVTVSGVTANTATISWNTDQPATSQVTYGTTTSYGSSSATNATLATSHSVVLNGLTAGVTYDFAAVSANSAGSSSASPNSTFTTQTVSNPAPKISNVSVASLTSTSANITWTTDQAASSEINYGTTTSYGSSTVLDANLVTSHSETVNGLTAGVTYNFDVVSANATGTSSTSANATFNTPSGITITAPVISNVATTGATGSSVTITWNTDQATTSLVNYGTTAAYGSSSTLATTLVTTHSVTLTGLAANTTYNFDVVSATAAGTSTTSANSTFQTPAGNSKAPYVGYVAYWGITNSGVTVSWSTDVPANTQIAYGTTAALGQMSSLQTSLTNSHGVVLSGLASATTYYFVAQSTGSNGVTGSSTTYSFTTTGAAVPGAPLVSTVTASNLTSTSATIAWTTDQASTSEVNYGTTVSYGSSIIPDSNLVTSHSENLTGLTPGTTYNFDVVSTNSSGTSSTSSNYTFVTPASTTTAGPPPVVSNVGVTSIGSTSATITWTTDQASSSQVDYGTSTAYGSSSVPDATMVTKHSVTLTGLAADTTYNFVVVSATSAANSTTSPNSSFTTATNTATPPYVGYVAYWGINDSGITVSWSTDMPANTVLAYGTTQALGQLTPVQATLTTSHGVVLTGLSSGTKYYFVAQSTSANGATGYSATYNFTTTGTTGTSAPAVSKVAVSAITGSSATVTWTTDQASSSQVNYGTTNAYGSSSTLSTALVTTHSVTLVGLTPGTMYNFDVVSADAAGLSTTSPNATFTTPTASGNAPKVDYVAFWGITGSEVTISWSTDVPSTTALAYGTTTSLGQLTSVQPSLTLSHGLTLTGLNPSTTYYFVAQSTNSAGVTGYSTTYTFTTQSSGLPTVSAINVATTTQNTAAVSWTTSVPTYSFVQYGTSTAYNHYSSQTGLTTNPQCSLSYVPSGVIHYQVVSTDAAGNKTVSPDYTFTEP